MRSKWIFYWIKSNNRRGDQNTARTNAIASNHKGKGKEPINSSERKALKNWAKGKHQNGPTKYTSQNADPKAPSMTQQLASAPPITPVSPHRPPCLIYVNYRTIAIIVMPIFAHQHVQPNNQCRNTDLDLPMPCQSPIPLHAKAQQSPASEQPQPHAHAQATCSCRPMPMPMLSLLSPLLPLSLLLPMLLPPSLEPGKLNHLYLDLSAPGGYE